MDERLGRSVVDVLIRVQTRRCPLYASIQRDLAYTFSTTKECVKVERKPYAL